MLRLCWHDWTDWSEPFDVEYQKSVGSFGDTVTEQRTIQVKDCKRCCKHRSRVVYEGQIRIRKEGK